VVERFLQNETISHDARAAHTYDELVHAKDVVNMAKVYTNTIFDYLELLSSDVRT